MLGLQPLCGVVGWKAEILRFAQDDVAIGWRNCVSGLVKSCLKDRPGF